MFSLLTMINYQNVSVFTLCIIFSVILYSHKEMKIIKVSDYYGQIPEDNNTATQVMTLEPRQPGAVTPVRIVRKKKIYHTPVMSKYPKGAVYSRYKIPKFYITYKCPPKVGLFLCRNSCKRRSPNVVGSCDNGYCVCLLLTPGFRKGIFSRRAICSLRQQRIKCNRFCKYRFGSNAYGSCRGRICRCFTNPVAPGNRLTACQQAQRKLIMLEARLRNILRKPASRRTPADRRFLQQVSKSPRYKNTNFRTPSGRLSPSKQKSPTSRKAPMYKSSPRSRRLSPYRIPAETKLTQKVQKPAKDANPIKSKSPKRSSKQKSPPSKQLPLSKATSGPAAGAKNQPPLSKVTSSPATGAKNQLPLSKATSGAAAGAKNKLPLSKATSGPAVRAKTPSPKRSADGRSNQKVSKPVDVDFPSSKNTLLPSKQKSPSPKKTPSPKSTYDYSDGLKKPSSNMKPASSGGNNKNFQNPPYNDDFESDEERDQDDFEVADGRNRNNFGLPSKNIPAKTAKTQEIDGRKDEFDPRYDNSREQYDPRYGEKGGPSRAGPQKSTQSGTDWESPKKGRPNGYEEEEDEENPEYFANPRNNIRQPKSGLSPVTGRTGVKNEQNDGDKNVAKMKESEAIQKQVPNVEKNQNLVDDYARPENEMERHDKVHPWQDPNKDKQTEDLGHSHSQKTDSNNVKSLEAEGACPRNDEQKGDKVDNTRVNDPKAQDNPRVDDSRVRDDRRQDDVKEQHDPRYNDRRGEYDPRYDGRKEEFEPRYDDRRGEYGPQYDDRKEEPRYDNRKEEQYDPRYDNRKEQYDPRYEDPREQYDPRYGDRREQYDPRYDEFEEEDDPRYGEFEEDYDPRYENPRARNNQYENPKVLDQWYENQAVPPNARNQVPSRTADDRNYDHEYQDYDNRRTKEPPLQQTRRN